MGLGIGFELAKGMQFGEDVESEQACLIDDEERLDFLVEPFVDGVANDAGENGAGKAFGFHIQGGGQLAVGLQNRAGTGGDPKGMVLRGMKAA